LKLKIAALLLFLGCGSITSRCHAQSPETTTPPPPTMTMKESKEHLIKEISVPTPPIALAAHMTGVVFVGAEVDPDGNVTTVVAISGPEMLKATAMDAVRQYKYRPFLIDGVPSTVRIGVQVTFYPGHTKSGK
jgi:TonB family protein